MRRRHSTAVVPAWDWRDHATNERVPTQQQIRRAACSSPYTNVSCVSSLLVRNLVRRTVVAAAEAGKDGNDLATKSNREIVMYDASPF